MEINEKKYKIMVYNRTKSNTWIGSLELAKEHDDLDGFNL